MAQYHSVQSWEWVLQMLIPYFPKIKPPPRLLPKRGGGSHLGGYGTYTATCTYPKRYYMGHTVATKKGPP